MVDTKSKNTPVRTLYSRIRSGKSSIQQISKSLQYLTMGVRRQKKLIVRKNFWSRMKSFPVQYALRVVQRYPVWSAGSNKKGILSSGEKVWYLKPYLWGCSSVGRALEWHSRGRRFDPDQLHHLLTLISMPCLPHSFSEGRSNHT